MVEGGSLGKGLVLNALSDEERIKRAVLFNEGHLEKLRIPGASTKSGLENLWDMLPRESAHRDLFPIVIGAANATLDEIRFSVDSLRKLCRADAKLVSIMEELCGKEARPQMFYDDVSHESKQEVFGTLNTYTVTGIHAVLPLRNQTTVLDASMIRDVAVLRVVNGETKTGKTVVTTLAVGRDYPPTNDEGSYSLDDVSVVAALQRWPELHGQWEGWGRLLLTDRHTRINQSSHNEMTQNFIDALGTQGLIISGKTQ